VYFFYKNYVFANCVNGCVFVFLSSLSHLCFMYICLCQCMFGFLFVYIYIYICIILCLYINIIACVCMQDLSSKIF